MRTTVAALLITTNLLGQSIKPTSEGPIYNSDGRMIAYNYADGTRELYSYNSEWQMNTFTDRAAKVTYFPLSNSAGGTSTTGNYTTSTSGPPDATLFTTYDIDTKHTSVGWLVCGSTQQSTGCYSSGSLGSFGKVGALIEGLPSTSRANTVVTRAIYVLDIASGSNQKGVTLYVYKKADTVSPSFDTVSVTLLKTVNLPLVGGSSVLASMAANSNFVVIGTNQSTQAVEVQKSNFAITSIGGFSPPINVSAITADKYGYVTVSFGSLSPIGSNGFVVLGPNGVDQEGGGGAAFMLGTQQAVLPSTFP
jgi:hypothetical protein